MYASFRGLGKRKLSTHLLECRERNAGKELEMKSKQQPTQRGRDDQKFGYMIELMSRSFNVAILLSSCVENFTEHSPGRWDE